MDAKIQEIIDVFKEAYPGLNPTKIYSVSNGYLIIAPKTATDFNDPQYFVSSDLNKVTKFGIQRREEMFKAFIRGPIWQRKG